MKKIIFLVAILAITASAFNLTNKQKHYWLGLGCGITGYSAARIITWNKYSNQDISEAEEMRRNISFFSGIGTAIVVGAGEELIWDLTLKKGNPEWTDFEATFIGGICGSLIGRAIDQLLIKRKEKSTAYLDCLYLSINKSSFSLSWQIKF